MNEFLSYVLVVFPGLCLAVILLCLLPFKETALRLSIIIIAFVLFRDALVTSGLWKITQSLEMRFIPNEFILLFLAVSSLTIAVLVPKLMQVPVVYFKSPKPQALLAGLIGSFAVILPLYLLRQTGLVADTLEKPSGAFLLTAMLIFCLFGNYLEEVIFRVGLQDYLIRSGLSTLRSVLISATVFALCHAYLAFTVTSVGVFILIFTLWEGLVCATLAARYGVIAATLAHGVGIFLIATSIL